MNNATKIPLNLRKRLIYIYMLGKGVLYVGNTLERNGFLKK